MCNPAAAGLAITLAGSAMKAHDQRQEGKARAEAAQATAGYNAQVAANEAETQRSLAMAELKKGADERSRVIRAGLAKQGETAAGMGGSGFTLDSGTNLGLLGQGAEEISHEASLAARKANMNAWQRLNAAAQAENDKALALFQGRQARNNGKSGLAATLLGGIGRGLAFQTARPNFGSH